MVDGVQLGKLVLYSKEKKSVKLGTGDASYRIYSACINARAANSAHLVPSAVAQKSNFDRARHCVTAVAVTFWAGNHTVQPTYNEHIGKWKQVHYTSFLLYLNIKCVQMVTGNKDFFVNSGDFKVATNYLTR